MFVAAHAAVALTTVHAMVGPPTPFTEEAVARGLVYQIEDYPQAHGNFGFGCGFADLDADGDQDVIILGRADTMVGIFENDGTGHFTDRTMSSGIPPLAEGSGFAAADYDGDGDIDIYFTQMALPNVLVRNDGGFQFTDVSDAAGVRLLKNRILGFQERSIWVGFQH